jgi:hypothetical protein
MVAVEERYNFALKCLRFGILHQVVSHLHFVVEANFQLIKMPQPTESAYRVKSEDAGLHGKSAKIWPKGFTASPQKPTRIHS